MTQTATVPVSHLRLALDALERFAREHDEIIDRVTVGVVGGHVEFVAETATGRQFGIGAADRATP